MASQADIWVRVEDNRWNQDITDPEGLCRRAVLAALQGHGWEGGPVEVSVLLSSDEEVRLLNRDYRGQDKPTNVLSFAALDGDMASIPGEPVLLGDIVIARETVCREALENGRSISDHTTHLAVHGTLHLLQYDHETDEEAAEMEALEVSILAGLGVADPYDESED